MVSFKWEEFLKKHRDEIVFEWGTRLKNDVSKHYAQRSPEELSMTTVRALILFTRCLSIKIMP